MPRATIASRQLKNKETGLDLSVPQYKEEKGRFQSTVYYQVVLVSNLACFKTPSHKETDVVQYSVEKKWTEFEELYKKVTAEFMGTVLPALNKKSLITNDVVLRERRNSLDQVVKFMASVAKIATCAPLLEFLGVDSVRAKKFSRGESVDMSEVEPSAQETSEGDGEFATEEGDVVDFEEGGQEAEGDDEMFANDKVRDAGDEEDIFGSDDKVQMFDRQDLKRELTEEDEKNFGFIPDAILTKTEKVRVTEEEYYEEEDEHSDLFKIISYDVTPSRMPKYITSSRLGSTISSRP